MPKRPPSTPRYGDELRLKDNPAAITGFILSLVQLVAHGSWIGLVVWLSEADRAAELDADSPLAWAIVILLGIATLLTFIAISVCLFRGFRRPPRVLAVVGFALSFFVGVFAFSVVILSFLRFAAG